MKRNSTGTDYGRLPLSSPAVSACGKSQSVVQLRGSGGWFALDEDRPSRSSLSSLDRSSESINRRFSIDVAEMLDNNYSDEDILLAWLDSIGFKQYAANFIDSGYNVQTVSRMTPEDLRAIGITKPDHRMRITAHLKRFVVPDSWPSYRPGLSRTWLYDIGLGEYAGMFESQGYRTVDDLRQLTWEDLEDIGVKKLGHMKRILLASKKLEQTRKERSSSGSASPRATAEIRPYAHMIFGQSPPVHPMVSEGSSNLITFQSSPRKKVSQKKPPIGNAGMLSSSFSDTCNTSDAVCNSPYSPFPRRTMAVVHPVPNEQLVNKNSSPRLTSVDCRLNLREMSKSQEIASVSHQCLCKSSEDGPLSVRYAGEKRRAQSTSGQSTAASPFRLSTHWDCASDSQLPGADELPPPPTLLCEASIQALRNVWRNPPMQAKAAAAATDDCGQQPVHRIANGNSLNKQNVMSRSVGSVSETMANGCFSNETNGTACSSSSSGKQSGSLLIGSTNMQQRASSRIRSAEGLDDIESMLQNLSDQLDALLIHPAA